MDIQAAIHHYCHYSERCHKDVRNKLYELGCTTPEVEQHLAQLIEVGMLNEQRYACAFARGKFRMQQWGRVKIIHQLKAHQVSAYCIRKALQDIDELEYAVTLDKLATKKLDSLRALRNSAAKKAKVSNYLLQKGFERDLVIDIVNKLINI